MHTAYLWASELADVSQLRITLDVIKRTQLISQINEILGHYINYDRRSAGSGLFARFPGAVKEIVLNHIDDIVRHYDSFQTNEKYRKSIGLRLWSGCLFSAKTIALETLDGPNTPETRTKLFLEQILLQIVIQFFVQVLNLHHYSKRTSSSVILSTAFHQIHQYDAIQTST